MLNRFQLFMIILNLSQTTGLFAPVSCARENLCSLFPSPMLQKVSGMLHLSNPVETGHAKQLHIKYKISLMVDVNYAQQNKANRFCKGSPTSTTIIIFVWAPHTLNYSQHQVSTKQEFHKKIVFWDKSGFFTKQIGPVGILVKTGYQNAKLFPIHNWLQLQLDTSELHLRGSDIKNLNPRDSFRKKQPQSGVVKKKHISNHQLLRGPRAFQSLPESCQGA